MANTIWKEVFLIMCSSSRENARNTERFSLSLRITDDYALQMLCGEQHKVCNEEGKINGMSLNRAIYDGNEMVEIIAGPCFICDCSRENFRSLSDEQLKRYSRQFKYPEAFIKMNGEIKAIPFTPDKSRER